MSGIEMTVFIVLVVGLFVLVVAMGWGWLWLTNRKRLKDGFETQSVMNRTFGGPRR